MYLIFLHLICQTGTRIPAMQSSRFPSQQSPLHIKQKKGFPALTWSPHTSSVHLLLAWMLAPTLFDQCKYSFINTRGTSHNNHTQTQYFALLCWVAVLPPFNSSTNYNNFPSLTFGLLLVILLPNTYKLHPCPASQHSNYFNLPNPNFPPAVFALTFCFWSTIPNIWKSPAPLIPLTSFGILSPANLLWWHFFFL